MFLKLIVLIFFLLIYVNISIGKNCECPKNGQKSLGVRRFKRGFGSCNCFKVESSSHSKKGKEQINGFVRFEEDELKQNEEVENVGEVGESSSSSTRGKGIMKKGKVLYIGDNFFFSHIQFNDMLIYTNTVTGRSVTSNVFNIINVPIDLNRFESTQTLEEQIKKYRFSNEFKHVGIYEEIIKNVEIDIPNVGDQPIFDWLQQQNYLFGIAEFETMSGSFAVFHALGIEKTFNVANTDLYNKYVKSRGIIPPLTLENLFENINSHFINQHPFGIFEDFPKLDDKIMYIGGLIVEKQGKLTQDKVEINEPPCVVYISFGSRKVSDISNIFGEKVIKQMIKEFEKHDNCIFKARLEEKFLPEKDNDSSDYSSYKNISLSKCCGKNARRCSQHARARKVAQRKIS
uniref:Glucuronosyltransferase n=1 Tax=Meloidogyne floridensis TaxID=298350 RepID=A0A915NGD8_9BILA